MSEYICLLISLLIPAEIDYPIGPRLSKVAIKLKYDRLPEDFCEPLNEVRAALIQFIPSHMLGEGVEIVDVQIIDEVEVCE